MASPISARSGLSTTVAAPARTTSRTRLPNLSYITASSCGQEVEVEVGGLERLRVPEPALPAAHRREPTDRLGAARVGEVAHDVAIALESLELARDALLADLEERVRR